MSKKILVLDKSKMVQSLFETAMPKGAWDWDVTLEGDQYLFLEVAKAVKPDVILLSNEEKKVGYPTVESLRSEPTTSKTPIILLTTARESLDDGQMVRLDVQGFLRKPFLFETLQEQLEDVLLHVEEQEESDFDGLEIVEDGISDLLKQPQTKLPLEQVGIEDLENELDPQHRLENPVPSLDEIEPADFSSELQEESTDFYSEEQVALDSFEDDAFGADEQEVFLVDEEVDADTEFASEEELPLDIDLEDLDETLGTQTEGASAFSGDGYEEIEIEVSEDELQAQIMAEESPEELGDFDSELFESSEYEEASLEEDSYDEEIDSSFDSEKTKQEIIVEFVGAQGEEPSIQNESENAESIGILELDVQLPKIGGHPALEVTLETEEEWEPLDIEMEDIPDEDLEYESAIDGIEVLSFERHDESGLELDGSDDSSVEDETDDVDFFQADVSDDSGFGEETFGDGFVVEEMNQDEELLLDDETLHEIENVPAELDPMFADSDADLEIAELDLDQEDTTSTEDFSDAEELELDLAVDDSNDIDEFQELNLDLDEGSDMMTLQEQEEGQLESTQEVEQEDTLNITLDFQGDAALPGHDDEGEEVSLTEDNDEFNFEGLAKADPDDQAANLQQMINLRQASKANYEVDTDEPATDSDVEEDWSLDSWDNEDEAEIDLDASSLDSVEEDLLADEAEADEIPETGTTELKVEFAPEPVEEIDEVEESDMKDSGFMESLESSVGVASQPLSEEGFSALGEEEEVYFEVEPDVFAMEDLQMNRIESQNELAEVESEEVETEEVETEEVETEEVETEEVLSEDQDLALDAGSLDAEDDFFSSEAAPDEQPMDAVAISGEVEDEVEDELEEEMADEFFSMDTASVSSTPESMDDFDLSEEATIDSDIDEIQLDLSSEVAEEEEVLDEFMDAMEEEPLEDTASMDLGADFDESSDEFGGSNELLALDEDLPDLEPINEELSESEGSEAQGLINQLDNGIKFLNAREEFDAELGNSSVIEVVSQKNMTAVESAVVEESDREAIEEEISGMSSDLESDSEEVDGFQLDMDLDDSFNSALEESLHNEGSDHDLEEETMLEEIAPSTPTLEVEEEADFPESDLELIPEGLEEVEEEMNFDQADEELPEEFDAAKEMAQAMEMEAAQEAQAAEEEVTQEVALDDATSTESVQQGKRHHVSPEFKSKLHDMIDGVVGETIKETLQEVLPEMMEKIVQEELEE